MLKRIALSLVVLFPVAAMAAGEDQWLQPRIETGLKYGSKRSIGGAELWIPVSQDYDRVLYADFRLTLDDQDNREVNAGLGYRRIVRLFEHDVILGGHGWLDRRITRYDSTLHQVTLGGEAYTRDWDFRINAYAPLNDESIHVTPTVGSSTPYLAGTGIYYNTTGLLLEEAQPGGDIEIGRRIPIFEDYAEAIRLYAGGFHFEGDQTENVSGWRVRLVADVTPDFSIGGRFQRDDERGTQGFLEATLRFPFASKQSFRKEGLRARLDESPERDIDIVTGGRVLDTGVAKPVLSSETGTQQRVLHVDNTADAGGDGTQENPFNTLKAAEAQLASHDVLYIHAGDGTTSGQDEGLMITLPNITVIGSGVDFVFDGSNFTTGTGSNLSGTLIAAATTAPVITNDTTEGDGVYSNAAYTYLSGFTVDGAARHGVFFDDAPNSTATRLTLNNNGTPLSVAGLGASGTDPVLNHSGIRVYLGANSANGSTEISHLNTTGNLVYDIAVQNVASSNYKVYVQNNTSVGTFSSPDSYVLHSNINIRSEDPVHNDFEVYIRDNTFSIGYFGIFLRNTEAGRVFADIRNNTSLQNRGDAITLRASGGDMDVNFTDNQVIENERTNLNLQSSLGSNLTLRASGNQYLSGLRTGISLTATGDGSLSARFADETVTGMGETGIIVNDDSTGSFVVDFGGGALNSTGHNSIYGNGTSNPTNYRDVSLDLDASPTPLAAQYNWWGQAGGPLAGQIISEAFGTYPAANTGTADTSNALNEAP